MGTNKGASQSGMAMGATRGVADMKLSEMDQSSKGVVNLQYGTTSGESQKGMVMGGRRNIMN